jgi:hypothetical protein
VQAVTDSSGNGPIDALVHANIITASILAVLSAVRRADARGLLPAPGQVVSSGGDGPCGLLSRQPALPAGARRRRQTL